MMLVERNSRVVLGIDDQSKDGDLGAQRAQSRVREKRGTQLAPLEGLVDRSRLRLSPIRDKGSCRERDAENDVAGVVHEMSEFPV